MTANLPKSKRFKLAGLRLLRALGVFHGMRILVRRRVAILCYHGIWRGSGRFNGDAMFISKESFARRLRLIYLLGYNVVPLACAVAYLKRIDVLPANALVITIDDGWYSTFADMLPLLEQSRYSATIYCDTENLEAGLPIPHVMATYVSKSCGANPLPEEQKDLLRQAQDLEQPRVKRLRAAKSLARALECDSDSESNRAFDYMTCDELAEAGRRGFDIQLHTHSHSLGDFSRGRCETEITTNRRALAAVTGQPPSSFTHFCYPSGLVSPVAGRHLAACGIESATTLVPRLAARGKDPLYLPRLLDGEHLSDIEFEAELCGIGEIARRIKSATVAALRRGTIPTQRASSRTAS